MLVIAALVLVILKLKKRKPKEISQSSVELAHIKPKEKQLSGAAVTDVEVGEKIGGGRFGEIYIGLLKGSIKVALKKEKVNNQELEKEAETLR